MNRDICVRYIDMKFELDYSSVSKKIFGGLFYENKLSDCVDNLIDVIKNADLPFEITELGPWTLEAIWSLNNINNVAFDNYSNRMKNRSIKTKAKDKQVLK